MTAKQIQKRLDALPLSERRHAFCVGRTLFRWMKRRHMIERSPFARMDTPPDNASRNRALNVIRRILEEPPPGAATHWTGRAMARARGVSPAKAHQIWQAAGLTPHRVRRFKLSTDPAFAAPIEGVVGLYVAAPKHAVVLSLDEKSQIQALDRTQPGLPMKPGRLGTMTHDYERHGTTTLFAALDVIEGTVIGQCMQRHRNRELIRSLNGIERQVPAGKVIHVILDNYAAHKHPNVRKWLTRHPPPSRRPRAPG